MVFSNTPCLPKAWIRCRRLDGGRHSLLGGLGQTNFFLDDSLSIYDIDI